MNVKSRESRVASRELEQQCCWLLAASCWLPVAIYNNSNNSACEAFKAASYKRQDPKSRESRVMSLEYKKEKHSRDRRVSFRYGIFFMLIVFLFQACYFDVIINEEPNTSEAVSFSKDLVPVFQASCVSCHDGQITQPDFSSSVLYTNLSTGNYLSVTDPENSTLITKIRSDHPYAGAVTETEIQKLITWMKEGAANN